MITDEAVESAVHFYAANAERAGELRGAIEAQKHRAKVMAATVFLDATGTVAERERIADTNQSVVEAMEAHHNAVADYETLRTQLKAAELRIEVWRSQQASSRRGHA